MDTEGIYTSLEKYSVDSYATAGQSREKRAAVQPGGTYQDLQVYPKKQNCNRDKHLQHSLSARNWTYQTNHRTYLSSNFPLSSTFQYGLGITMMLSVAGKMQTFVKSFTALKGGENMLNWIGLTDVDNEGQFQWIDGTYLDTNIRMADDVLYASVNFSQKNRQPRKQEEQDTEATRDQRDEVIYAEVKAANSQETQKEETEAGTCQPIKSEVESDPYSSLKWKRAKNDIPAKEGTCQPIKSEVESDPYSSLKWKRAKNDIPAKEDLTPFKDKGAVNEMKQNYSINEQHLMQLRRQYDILNREHSNLSEYQKTLQMNLTSLQSLYSNLSAYLTKLLSNYSTLNQENAEFSAVIEKLNKRCPISNSLSQSRICYVCPQNWMLFNSKCYSFSSNKLTWTGGVEGCRQHEAHLVIIESEEEQTFLLNELSKQSPKKTYWIGLNDIANEGQFVWVDNKRLDRSKSFWGVNWDGTMEPDNWRNQENCVKIQKTATASGWYDAYCLETNNVICERAAEGITL
ncbi:FCER2 protein, partial [Polypterus senegalus]|nr:FCER2 protein [Polypterus senegalus]